MTLDERPYPNQGAAKAWRALYAVADELEAQIPPLEEISKNKQRSYQRAQTIFYNAQGDMRRVQDELISVRSMIDELEERWNFEGFQK